MVVVAQHCEGTLINTADTVYTNFNYTLKMVTMVNFTCILIENNF